MGKPDRGFELQAKWQFECRTIEAFVLLLHCVVEGHAGPVSFELAFPRTRVDQPAGWIFTARRRTNLADLRAYRSFNEVRPLLRWENPQANQVLCDTPRANCASFLTFLSTVSAHDASSSRRWLCIRGRQANIGFLSHTHTNMGPREIARSSSDHRDLIDAIRSGDEDWAASLMRLHVSAARNTIMPVPNTPQPG